MTWTRREGNFHLSNRMGRLQRVTWKGGECVPAVRVAVRSQKSLFWLQMLLEGAAVIIFWRRRGGEGEGCIGPAGPPHPLPPFLPQIQLLPLHCAFR
jgi:hypothetical protein